MRVASLRALSGFCHRSEDEADRAAARASGMVCKPCAQKRDELGAVARLENLLASAVVGSSKYNLLLLSAPVACGLYCLMSTVATGSLQARQEQYSR